MLNQNGPSPLSGVVKRFLFAGQQPVERGLRYEDAPPDPNRGNLASPYRFVGEGATEAKYFCRLLHSERQPFVFNVARHRHTQGTLEEAERRDDERLPQESPKVPCSLVSSLSSAAFGTRMRRPIRVEGTSPLRAAS